MVDPQLIDYVKKSWERNIPKEEIEKTLISVGWKKEDIDAAFKVMVVPPPTVPMTPVPNEDVTATTFIGPIALLREALKIYFKRFWKFMGILSLPYLIEAVFVIIALIVFAVIAITAGISTANLNLQEVVNNPQSVNSILAGKPMSFVLPLIIFAIVFFLLVIVMQLWGQIALLTEAVSDTKIGIKEAYEKSKGKIFRYWWLMVVSSFVLFGATILLVIPGIILGIAFSFAIFVLISEDIGSLSALLRSREYVKKHWWGVLARLFFIGLVPTVVGIIVSLISSKVLDPAGLSYISSGLSIILSLVSLFYPPLSMVYLALMYRNLRALKKDTVSISGGSRVAFVLLAVFGALVVPAIIFGLIMLGVNPAKQLEKARDARRRSDLSILTGVLQTYYSVNSKCPFSLEELISQYNIKPAPTDPLTKTPYKYELSEESGSSCQICINLEEGGMSCSEVPPTVDLPTEAPLVPI